MLDLFLNVWPLVEIGTVVFCVAGIGVILSSEIGEVFDLSISDE